MLITGFGGFYFFVFKTNTLTKRTPHLLLLSKSGKMKSW